jgi:2-polyprenyl-3-methyl-5-hydroxy-6-metoxy-1,4-benzoquinol methylase
MLGDEPDQERPEQARPELLALVPRDARRVLDIGCAGGLVGWFLRRRQACEVIGIEVDPLAAADARSRLDKVVEADIEGLDLSSLGVFDAIVCGDVLEHLREPERVLQRLAHALAPGGALVASIPNVQHISVLSALCNGDWIYESEGLLDRRHLRFFTRRSAERLLTDSGFEVVEVQEVPSDEYQEWQSKGCPNEVRTDRLLVSELTADEARRFFVYQWLFVARRRT